MTMKSHLYLKSLFLGLFFLLTPQARGQHDFSVTAGLGYPELLNLGVRYQVGQSQLGLHVGSGFGDEEDNDFSVGADYFYHFEGFSHLSTRRTWYGRIGLYYYSSKQMYEEFQYLLLAPRLGKEFNLSPRIGMTADAGISQILSRLKEDPVYIDAKNKTTLSLGFSIFYRL